MTAYLHSNLLQARMQYLQHSHIGGPAQLQSARIMFCTMHAQEARKQERAEQIAQAEFKKSPLQSLRNLYGSEVRKELVHHLLVVCNLSQDLIHVRCGKHDIYA